MTYLALPIVDDLHERKVIGMVRRFDIAGADLAPCAGPFAVSRNLSIEP